MKKIQIVSVEQLSSKVYEFRGRKVMLDKDLAEFYGVSVKRLNEQVKRNNFRFEKGFYFQLNEAEMSEYSRSQNATLNSKRGGNIKYPPYVFTRDGAVMASYVLNSEVAVQKSIYVVKAFNAISDIMPLIKELFRRVESLEKTTDVNNDVNMKFRWAVNKMLIDTSRRGEFVVLLEDMEQFKKEFGEIKSLIQKIEEKSK